MSVDPVTLLRRFADRYERRMATLAIRSGEGPIAVAAWTMEGAAFAFPAATDDIERTFARTEEAAALVGRFDPTAIAGPGVNDDLRRQVLSRLVPFCDVVTADLRLSWIMRLARRASVLRRLVNENRLSEALGVAPSPDDGFGSRLREILLAGSTSPVDLESAQDCMDLLSAAEAVTQAGLPVPDLARLRQRTARQLFLEEFHHLVEHGVFGRVTEERALRDFVAAPSEPSADARRWRGLTVTGIGGSGKSTLMARMIQNIVGEGTAVVVVLDFDRPGIDAAQTTWLEFEISRQVGHQRPELAEGLSALRQDVRAKRALEASEGIDGKRGFRMPLANLLADAADPLRIPGMVIILDTFEIVVERELEEALASWLDELTEALSGWDVKVVFSGRLDETSGTRLGSSPRIVLGDLSKAAAVRVLMAHGVTKRKADEVASLNVLPRRPLELRFLSGLLTGPDAIDPAEIEAELRMGGTRTADLFLSTVYRRVLLRIDDAEARTLAHPGLVLRFVTPEIVSRLLAPTLGLTMDDATASKALAALVRHGWLVFRGPDDTIWHKSEVRRTMLRAMEAGDPGQARRIHEAAILWFSGQRSPAADAEATYHRLMLARTPEEVGVISPAAVKAAVRFIDRDVADLHPAAAAFYGWVKKGQVSLDMLRLLPPGSRAQATNAVGRRLVASRRFATAHRLLQDYPKERGAIDAGPDSWENAVRFATAEWDRATFIRHRGDGRRDPSFLDLVAELYSACLMDPYPGRLSELTDRLDQEPEGTFRALSERHGERLLNRLGMIAVTLAALGPVSKSDMRAIARLVAHYHAGGKVFLAERRLVMLSRIVGSSQPVNAAVSPALFCLDPGGSNASGSEAVMSLPREVALQLATMEQAVRESMSLNVGRQTVRRFLADVDASWRRISHDTTPIVTMQPSRMTPEALRLYRGPDPEFRDPVRFALLEAFGDGPGLRRLGCLLAEIFPFGFRDLEPDAFEREVRRDPENKLEPYVELADRAWILDRVLAAGVRAAPNSRKLPMVQSAYSRWKEAADRALL